MSDYIVVYSPVNYPVTFSPVAYSVAPATLGPQGPPGPAGSFSGTLQGTAHEINVSTSGGTTTLSTPQPIDTVSSPSFVALTLNNTGGPAMVVTNGKVGIHDANPQAALLIQTADMYETGLIVDGSANQQGLLTMWRDHGDNMLVGISNTGTFQLNDVPNNVVSTLATSNGAFVIQPPGATNKALVLKEAANQSANVFEIQTNGGTVVCHFDPAIGLLLGNTYTIGSTGVLFVQTGQGCQTQVKTLYVQITDTSGNNPGVNLYPSSSPQCVYVSPGATSIGVIVIAAPLQSGDLQQWQNSDTSVASQIDAKGAWHPPALADSAAQNGSVYYSTTANKLVYKDSGGIVNNLY